MFSKNLKKFLKLQKIQNVNYKPTYFWDELSTKLANEILKGNNINQFRSLDICKHSFVPGYNTDFEKKIKLFSQFVKKNYRIFNIKKINDLFFSYLNGFQSALADYRVFRATDNKGKFPKIHNFTESTIGNPSQQFRFEKKKYSRSSLHYLIGLCFLKKHLNEFVPKTFLEIGGGFGTLGEILGKSKIKELKYINVDIAPIIIIAEWYISKIFNKKNIFSCEMAEKHKILKISKLKNFNFLCPWHVEKLKGTIDVFVNFISFQEMEPDIVNNYIKKIFDLKPKLILLRNLKEGRNKKSKLRPKGVIKPIKSNFYIKKLKKKYILIDRDIYSFGEKKIDMFSSEILLFKKK